MSFSSWSIRSPKPAPTSARRSASRRSPSRSIAARTPTRGSPPSRLRGSRPRPRGGTPRLGLLGERQLAVVLVFAVRPRVVGGRSDADARVGGELGQLVGAALRLDQVGGEHRVVLEAQLDALAGGGGEQAMATAAEALQVVAGERLVGESDRELVVGVRPGDDALAFGGGPA